MLTSIIKLFKPNDVLSKRIKHRHNVFWNSPEAEAVRNTMMLATDPIEKWKDCSNWQRKLSNKHNAREFAKMHGCRVADLYWMGRDVNMIDFEGLPDQYVIRPTVGHSCKMVFLMNNGVNLLDQRVYSPEDIKRILSLEAERYPEQQFLIEEFLRTESGEYRIPADYKFLSFNGEIASIVVIERIGRNKGFQNFYDENWNPLKVITGVYPPGERYKDPPACLTEMIAHARRLSREYGIFVRVDFYATDKGAVFGEFTPTPSRGDGFTPYGEKLLTYYWDEYCNGMI